MKLSDIKAALRNGQYAWPGGYPLYFLTTDGEALSFEAVKGNWRSVVASVLQYHSGHSDWRITEIDINWEDDSLTCAHTGKLIASAYGEVEP